MSSLSSPSLPLAADTKTITGKPAVVTTSKFLEGHSDAVSTVEVCSDGSLAVTASSDKTVRVWSCQEGECTAVLRGHNAVVWSAGFSPNSMFIVSTGENSGAKVWEISSQTCKKTFYGINRSASFSPKGTQIMCSTTWQTEFHPVSLTTEAVLQFTALNPVRWSHNDEIHNTRFSPNEDLVAAACSDHSALVWNCRSQTRVADLRGHSGQVWTADFSPDARQVVTSSSDKTARIWEVETSKEVAILRGHSRAVYCAAFAPKDANRVVTASVDKTARVWNVASACCVVILEGHTMDVNSAAFFPDGKQVVTASDDGTVRIWQLPHGMEADSKDIDADDDMSSIGSKDFEQLPEC